MTPPLHLSLAEESAWRRPISVLLFVFATILLTYRETAVAMVSIWSRSDTFAHCFLVLPITLWLIWRQRRELAVLQPQPCPWILLPMAAMAFTWLLGDLAWVNSLAQFALTALLVLAVPAVLGVRVARAMMFPLGFLFFAVPVGEFLLPQLMSWTADFTVLALRASSVPVYREGNHFTIPSGNWSVVEACSGVRYLIASFMVGTLFAYLNYRSPRRRWIFVAVAIAVPIVANWVRAYAIVMLGHLSGNRLAVGADHLIYGWLFFGVVVGVMYMIGVIWSESPSGSRTRQSTEAAASRSSVLRERAPFYRVAAAAALLGFVPHLILWQIGTVDEVSTLQWAHLTDLAVERQADDDETARWRPAFGNPSAELNSTYTSQGRKVGAYIGYYRAQNYGHKLISSENELVKSNDPAWAAVSDVGSHALQTPTRNVDVRTTLLRRVAAVGRPEQRMVVWQLYWVGDKVTASDQWAKLYGAIDRVLKRRDDSAVIVLYSLEERPGEATALLDTFARAHIDAIVDQLRRSRNGLRSSVAVSLHHTLGEQWK